MGGFENGEICLRLSTVCGWVGFFKHSVYVDSFLKFYLFFQYIFLIKITFFFIEPKEEAKLHVEWVSKTLQVLRLRWWMLEKVYC